MKVTIAPFAIVPFVPALPVTLPLNAGAREKEQKMDHEKEQLFENLDTNKDNKVSVAEPEDNTVLMNDFITVDKDGNNEQATQFPTIWQTPVFVSIQWGLI